MSDQRLLLLEGAELILWQQHQLKLQAKHIDHPPTEIKAQPYQVATETEQIEEQARKPEEGP